jgi:hypothetical protein
MARWFAALICFLSCTAAASAHEGRIVDGATGAGIAGATVTLGNQVAQTDAGGRFRDDGTATSVQARAPGYRAAATVEANFLQGGSVLKLIPFRAKALYLSFYGIGSKALRESALKLIHGAKLNAVVIDVKGDRGLIAFRSGLPLAAAVGAQRLITIPDLPGLIRNLHQAGIYAIARIVTFKDDPLATARPDLGIRLANGSLFRDREGLAWTNPSLQQVRDYNIAVAVEAARSGFDEIQFDYLRFPDAPRGEKFAALTTETSRVEAIDEFLGDARRQLRPYNVYLSADSFGYVCWNTNDTGIGQELERMLPLVDYLSPMLYPSGFRFGIPGYPNPVSHPYEIVRLSLERARERSGVAPIRFRPWLQAFKDYAFDRRVFAAQEVTAQIRAAGDFGSDGWMLWNPRNTYAGAGLAELEPPSSAPTQLCS